MKTSDTREIVPLGGENRLHMCACRFRRRDVAVAQSPVDLYVRLFGSLGIVVCKCHRDRVASRRLIKSSLNFFVGREAEYAEKRRHRKVAFAVDLHIHGAISVGFDLYPHAACGDDLCCEIALAFVGN